MIAVMDCNWKRHEQAFPYPVLNPQSTVIKDNVWEGNNFFSFMQPMMQLHDL
jgi:hypothetical protein